MVAEADDQEVANVAEVDEQDKESLSDAMRFIISDLSDIFISDILMGSIDWLGTYLLDLLGTFDFPSLSTSLVSYKKINNHQHHVSACFSDVLIRGWSDAAV